MIQTRFSGARCKERKHVGLSEALDQSEALGSFMVSHVSRWSAMDSGSQEKTIAWFLLVLVACRRVKFGTKSRPLEDSTAGI